MAIVNVHDAKTHLSRLIGEVEAGARITIARAGKPAAQLVPVVPRPRTGFLIGQIRVPADFDSMDAGTVAALFEGA